MSTRDKTAKETTEPAGGFLPATMEVAGAPKDDPKDAAKDAASPFMAMLEGFEGGAFDDIGEVITWTIPTKKAGWWSFNMANTEAMRQAIQERAKTVEIVTAFDPTTGAASGRSAKEVIKQGMARATLSVRSVDWGGEFFRLPQGKDGSRKSFYDPITDRTYYSGDIPPANDTFITMQHFVVLAAAEQYLTEIDPFFGRNWKERRQASFRAASGTTARSENDDAGPAGSHAAADA